MLCALRKGSWDVAAGCCERPSAPEGEDLCSSGMVLCTERSPRLSVDNVLWRLLLAG